MSMSNTSETKLLQLLFQNDAWELIGDAAGLQPSATAGSFFVALHTADPGGGGGGLTPAQEALLDLIRAAVAGKAIINPAGTQIDLYAEDGTTILRSLSVSPDLKTRTPI